MTNRYGPPTLISERAQPIMYTAHKQIIWTEREEQRLMNSYKKIPREKLLMLFPDRTWCALVTRASRLRIPRPGRWYTPEEDARLLELYHETDLTYDQMSGQFMVRNGNSLKQRMYAIRKSMEVNGI
ncbi:unnamed protein product [marine sediment metagenome]|uniref:Myb-like domain-containing protein n=1 Tax=marine sediment metagenome TaxID=412755 RepID=X1E430_9ZZZZ